MLLPPTPSTFSTTNSCSAWPRLRSVPCSRRGSVHAEAFLADLSYAPENRQFRSQRRDSVIGFAGEEYKIVEISENEVVVSNRLNDKKTRLKRTP